MGDGGSNSADPYIGSVISLTSKSEIRYEGILYTVDTENSNIALQNVRSFGTEGRKKEGPQIPASDKVYEYIIFRGTDIKDLQVKSSPPVQAPLQPHSDPAIISLQAHYSQSPSLPPVYRSADQNSSMPFPGVPAAAFRNGVPSLYQPAPPMGSWGPPLPPPGANGTGLAMPLYWPGPGYYRNQTGQPHLQHHPLPHSVPLPPIQPQPLVQSLSQASLHTVSSPASSMPLQPPNYTSQSYAALATAATSLSSPLAISFGTTGTSATSAALSSQSYAALATAATSLSSPLAISFGTTGTSATSAALSSATSSSSSFTSLPQGISAVITPASKTPRRELGLVHPSQLQSQYTNTLGTNTSLPTLDTDLRVTSPIQRTSSGQQQASGIVSAFDKAPVASVQVHKQEHKLTEPLQSSSQPLLSASVSAQHQHVSTQPLLPLPSAAAQPKPVRQGNGSVAHAHYIRRGRGRGRAAAVGHPMQQFMEDFDFIAMNEKFNKDEVWGELGKGDTRETSLEEEEDHSDGHVDDTVLDSPVYVKDDFFDSLSCDALNRGEGRSERTKFSEQRKIDTETFGSFPTRSHGGRGMRTISRRGGYRGGYYVGRSSGGQGNTQGRGHGTMRSSNAM
ncbi:hypothetical protein O6H91_07G047500 [Diphasiastrum complanatum]|uniref:Uncharacterized protein n=1 Tax=Diphasiastrum complanatum TaxID=34168 RepID=A0ACC2D540_DIPCM|nr:hypothetical protein O6H91_07G047500 [Diphasiastrum complanatum]